MTLVLSNEEIGRLISMEEVIDRLDVTYQDLGNGAASARVHHRARQEHRGHGSLT